MAPATGYLDGERTVTLSTVANPSHRRPYHAALATKIMSLLVVLLCVVLIFVLMILIILFSELLWNFVVIGGPAHSAGPQEPSLKDDISGRHGLSTRGANCRLVFARQVRVPRPVFALKGRSLLPGNPLQRIIIVYNSITYYRYSNNVYVYIYIYIDTYIHT